MLLPNNPGPATAVSHFDRGALTADHRVLYPKWQPQLMAAIKETDPAMLPERIREAQEVLSKRLDRILGSKSHAAEINAIEEAMDDLELLKRKAGQPKAS